MLLVLLFFLYYIDVKRINVKTLRKHRLRKKLKRSNLKLRKINNKLINFDNRCLMRIMPQILKI